TPEISLTKTLASASANISAIVRPAPEAAPVMRTRRSLTLMIVLDVKTTALPSKRSRRQNVGERVDQDLSVLFLEHERRPDFQDIGAGTGGADQHARTARRIDEMGSQFGIRFFSHAIPDEFQTNKKTRASHIADFSVFDGELFQPLTHVATDDTRVFDEMIVRDNIERCQRSGARHGVAAKRIEITRRASELLDDPGFYDH